MPRKITLRKSSASPKPETRVRVKKTKTQPAAKAKKSARFGLHSLTIPQGARTHQKLLGRGPSSGHGKTSTRGSKGQTSRAGRHFYLGFEGGQSPLIRRFPKRGFTSKFKKEYQIVNLSDLSRIKESEINPEILVSYNLIKDQEKRVKVLGDGKIERPINLTVHAISRQAREKVTQAGGKIQIMRLGEILPQAVEKKDA